MSADCPEIEALLADCEQGSGPALSHAAACADCTLILDEHRTLEAALFRLEDPLPPPDFVAQVMRKVAARPVEARREMLAGLGILGSALMALFWTVGLSGLLVSAAIELAATQTVLAAGIQGLTILWRTAAVPVSLTCLALLGLSLWVIRRMNSMPPGHEALS